MRVKFCDNVLMMCMWLLRWLPNTAPLAASRNSKETEP
jgi:hypothetical protein